MLKYENQAENHQSVTFIVFFPGAETAEICTVYIQSAEQREISRNKVLSSKIWLQTTCRNALSVSVKRYEFDVAMLKIEWVFIVTA